jgi:hypothetical protein
MSRLDLFDARTEMVEDVLTGNQPKVVIAVSSYESRSTHIHALICARSAIPIESLVVAFSDLDTAGARAVSDEYFRMRGINISRISSGDAEGFFAYIQEGVRRRIEASTGIPVEIHVDFSCMPRRWYCWLLPKLAQVVRNTDRVFFWYTPGQYIPGDFPATGIDDLELFSGTASLAGGNRTHLFGLGFERARTEAIWSVMDPQNLVCFYADPAVNPDYVGRVKAENRDILLAAQHSVPLPLTDFVKSLSRLRDIVNDFSHGGDVIIVPDGPKPLILAASLVPILAAKPGITCFHIKRRQRRSEHALDVKASAPPVGFSVRVKLSP